MKQNNFNHRIIILYLAAMCYQGDACDKSHLAHPFMLIPVTHMTEFLTAEPAVIGSVNSGAILITWPTTILQSNINSITNTFLLWLHWE